MAPHADDHVISVVLLVVLFLNPRPLSAIPLQNGSPKDSLLAPFPGDSIEKALTALTSSRSSKLRVPNKRVQADAACVDILPMPSEPFRVVWNHPDPCEPHAPLHLSDYGIVANSNRQFFGDQIKLYYDPGKWPMFNQNGSAVNGGLPQVADPYHYDVARKSILERMDSPDFSGLGVLDFENWRPVFEGNFGSMRIYQDKSRDLARLLHPDLNTTELGAEAERAFNYAARNLFEKTLAIAQELMPDAHWGYYYHPRIWGYDINYTSHVNNKLDWLFKQSTGLFPRIYMDDPKSDQHVTRETNARYVRETLKETLRVKNAFSRPNTPIYGYSKSQYGLSDLYTKDDLDIAIGMPAAMGIDGVVIWGSSYYYHQVGSCQRLQVFVQHVLGPYVLNLSQFLKDCSHQLCAGHGRCVDANYLSPMLSPDMHPASEPHTSGFHGYKCQCYSPWGGADCKEHLVLPCRRPHGSSTEKPVSPLVG